MMPLVESKLGAPTIAAIRVQWLAIFSMAMRLSVIKSSCSRKSCGRAPHTANSGNTMNSALIGWDL